MQRAIGIALALATALGGCAPPTSPPPPPAIQLERPYEKTSAVARPPVDGLLELMRQRLLVQHEVARYKWHAQLPIPDAKREQQLLEEVEGRARGLGLGAGLVREFFRAQMEAGKLVQQGDFDLWRRGDATPPATGPDLAALRLQLDGLNGKLLHALKEAAPGLSSEGREAVRARAEVLLRGQGITAEVRRTACAPLPGS